MDANRDSLLRRLERGDRVTCTYGIRQGQQGSIARRALAPNLDWYMVQFDDGQEFGWYDRSEMEAACIATS